MSYAGLGQLAGTQCGDMPDVGQEMGIEPRARTSAGLRIIPTVWAQRALNAAGTRVTVDGIAGPATLSALVSTWTRMGRSGAQPALVDAGHVAISPGFEGRLSIMRRVPDPSGSRCGPCQWSACSGATQTAPRTTSTSTTTSTTLNTSSTTSEERDNLDPAGGSPMGLIARYGIWPWVIGGTALVGVGLWFLIGAGAGSVRANRRRRMRRNVISDYSRYSAAGTPGQRRELSARDQRAREQRELEEQGFTGAYWGYDSELEEEDLPRRRRRRTVRRNTRGHTEEYVVNSVSAAQTKWFKSKEKALNFARGLKRAGHDVRVEWRKMKWGEHTVASRAITVNYGKNLTWYRSKAAKAKRRSAKARRRTSRGTPRRIAANWVR